ncbi:MAG: glucokinase [Spirochaetes bacterium]|nr:MAG: glucokinase [Spirochaetota bacterium]
MISVLSRPFRHRYNASMIRKSSAPLILAGDIGGTNTNLALVRYDSGSFKVLFSQRFATKEQISLIAPIERFLDVAKNSKGLENIDCCCISGAGPVENGSISLTNAAWSISARDIQDRFGFPTTLINDFTAISYAVMLLDENDPQKILRLPHTDGHMPNPIPGMALVVGAGTGLGVGFIDRKPDGSCHAYPSEGGHSEASSYDALSSDLIEWTRQACGYDPGIELFVSGQGIENIFTFLCSSCFNPDKASPYENATGLPSPNPEPMEESILGLDKEALPAAVAANAKRLPRCSLAMEIFTQFYARKVSSLASIFLPVAGIYLAGGISSKNQDLLLENNRFMKIFERNYAPHIRDFLCSTPVLLVRDYSISLLGAANAAVQKGGLE